MLGVHTSIASLQIQRAFGQQQSAESVAMERLSTGKRINSAKDDASSLFSVQKQTMDIKASQQVNRGLGDAISYSQIAEGSLNQVQNLLHRANELAVQASNVTVEDRTGIDKEWSQIKDQIDQIVNGTSAFGTSPLIATSSIESGLTRIDDLFSNNVQSNNISPSTSPVAAIPAGATNITITVEDNSATQYHHDIEIFTRDGKHLSGTHLFGGAGSVDIAWRATYGNIFHGADILGTIKDNVLKEEYGFKSTATYDQSNLNRGEQSGDFTIYHDPATHATTENGMIIKYTGDSDQNSSGYNNSFVQSLAGEVSKQEITIDNVTEELIVFILKPTDPTPTDYDITVSWDSMPSDSDMKILTDTRPTGDSSFVTIDKTAVDTSTLSIDSLDLTTQSGAQSAITSIQSAMDTISQHRAYYGAVINRMETTRQSVTDYSFSTTQSRSRLEDTDFAKETATLTRSQILKQAATSMLGHVKTNQQQVLALLNTGV
jgi:flagellin